ncbi:hypothetical protein EDD86DRAFT_266249 [Gorgonomyces haynaldii]|nr:hypothetical protein EDD86DRAFT_266249 [Gorgonomyces haynaldii]
MSINGIPGLLAMYDQPVYQRPMVLDLDQPVPYTIDMPKVPLSVPDIDDGPYDDFDFDLMNTTLPTVINLNPTVDSQEYHSVYVDFRGNGSTGELDFLKPPSNIQKRSSVVSDLCSAAFSLCNAKLSVPDKIEFDMCSTDVFTVVPCKTQSEISYWCGLRCKGLKCKRKTCTRTVCVPGTEKTTISTQCGVTLRWKVASLCDNIPANWADNVRKTKAACKCLDKLSEFFAKGLGRVLDNADEAESQIIVEAMRAAADTATCFGDTLGDVQSNQFAQQVAILGKYDVVKWAPAIDTSMYLQFAAHAILCYEDALKVFTTTIRDSMQRILAQVTSPDWKPFNNVAQCLTNRYLQPFSAIIDPMCCPTSLVPRTVQTVKNEFANLQTRIAQYEQAASRLSSLPLASFASQAEKDFVLSITNKLSTSAVQTAKTLKTQADNLILLFDQLPSMMSQAADNVIAIDTTLSQINSDLKKMDEGFNALQGLFQNDIAAKIDALKTAIEIIQEASVTSMRQLFINILKKGRFPSVKDIFGVLTGDTRVDTAIKDIQKFFKDADKVRKLGAVVDLIDDIKKVDVVADAKQIGQAFEKLVTGAKLFGSQTVTGSARESLQSLIKDMEKNLTDFSDLAKNPIYGPILQDIQTVKSTPKDLLDSVQKTGQVIEAEWKEWGNNVTQIFSNVSTNLQNDWKTLPKAAQTIADCDPVISAVSDYSREFLDAVRKWDPSKIKIGSGVVSYNRWTKINFDLACTRMSRQSYDFGVLKGSFDYPEFYRCTYENKIPLPNHHVPYLGISLGLPTIKGFPALPPPGDVEDGSEGEDNTQAVQKRDFLDLSSLTDLIQNKRNQCKLSDFDRVVKYPNLTVPCLPLTHPAYADHTNPHADVQNPCLMDMTGVIFSKLSPHFSVLDFLSGTNGNGKKKDPFLRLDPSVVECMQAVREHLGIPITINSGYRNPKHNSKVSSSKPGFHVSGTAVDVTHGDIHSYSDVTDFALTVLDVCYRKFGMDDVGIGFYPNRIHFDKRGGNTIFKETKITKTVAVGNDAYYTSFTNAYASFSSAVKSKLSDLDTRTRTFTIKGQPEIRPTVTKSIELPEKTIILTPTPTAITITWLPTIPTWTKTKPVPVFTPEPTNPIGFTTHLVFPTKTKPTPTNDPIFFPDPVDPVFTIGNPNRPIDPNDPSRW